MADLTAVEARLRAILEPYRADLESANLYGVDTLRQAGARSHDWFAGIRVETGHVGFFLLTMYVHPELLDELSPALRKRKTGKSVFRFTAVDDALFDELTAFVARAHAVYLAEHPKAG